MRNYPATCFLLLSISFIGCVESSGENLPPFLVKLVELYEAGSPDSSPGSVWKYSYKDSEVFYFPPLYCCDIPSELYNIEGKVMCSPDGGFAGVGDGKCPDFLEERKDGVLLWKDTRVVDQ